MSRRTEAPAGMECPYRHNCPHLDHLPAIWVKHAYHEAARLRQQLHVMEQRYQQRIAELEKALLERDQKIARLRQQHQRQFKTNKPDPPPVKVKVRRPGARRGTPAGIAANPTTSMPPCRSPPPSSAPTAATRT